MHDIHSLKETTGIRASQRYFSFEISGGPERTEFCVFGGRNCLSPLSGDTASQLDVLGHADEELSVLLVTSDLTESHCSRPVNVGLLDSSLRSELPFIWDLHRQRDASANQRSAFRGDGVFKPFLVSVLHRIVALFKGL